MNTTTETKALYAIQWDSEDWLWLAQIAKQAGLSRSEFVRRAAIAAAKATADGMTPYFVGAPKATTQNTHINNSDLESAAKEGGIGDVVSRRCKRGVAKGTDEAKTKKRNP